MCAQRWQVGLDIQASCIRALAILRCRYGWRVCYWWQKSLPPGILQDGNLQQPGVLSKLLQPLRKQLPKNISLRIALPAQRILQQIMPVPDRRLKEPERSEFIQLSAAKKFPLDGQELAFDYRITTKDSTELLITAARQQEITCWQNCLQQVDLSPEVIDITPSILRCMAAAAELSPQYMLLHRLENEWLWVSPLTASFRYGLIPITQELLPMLKRIYVPTYGPSLLVYYSSTVDVTAPANTITWSPFTAFQPTKRSLPELPMAFTFAGGLAVRPADC